MQLIASVLLSRGSCHKLYFIHVCVKGGGIGGEIKWGHLPIPDYCHQFLTRMHIVQTICHYSDQGLKIASLWGHCII